MRIGVEGKPDATIHREGVLAAKGNHAKSG